MNYYLDVLKKYADFNGRARRSEYWMFMLFHFIVLFALLFFASFSIIFMVLYVVYAIATILPGLGVGIRRMHDVGKSGWFIFIPIYNLILACTEGEKETNQYGPDPKNPNEINEIGSHQ